MDPIRHQRATRSRGARRTAIGALAALAISTLGALPAAADEKHRVSSGETVSGLAVAYGTTVARIVEANDLDSRATIYIGQTLSIPGSAKATSSSARSDATHTVVPGDTVWDLARQHGTTVAAVIAANGLNSSATIRTGQTLTIPGSLASASSPASTGSASSAPTTTASHTVVAGDTVWALARTYGTSVAAITKANSLGASAIITVGQTLSIPGATDAGTAVANGTAGATLATPSNISSFGTSTASHTVASGETLSSIAQKHGVTVATIASANGIKNPSLIRIGQRLTIPGSVPTGLVGDTFAGRTYSSGIVASANQNKATLLATDVPSRDAMQSLVIRTAQQMGVDPALAQAIAYQESGFNMRAVSPANAIGTMQVIPTSGEWASDMVGRDLNLLVPEDNVVAGVAILRQLTRSSSSLETAIAGYYQGAASVRKYGMFADTQRYVANVLILMERFD
ncbi:lytic transglycosylase domain-containing protein [Demequina zhanjiangensis]|uniref:LysM peptidoglycan-binding domain-containing protein n=1 Tax=Demequina zhanjiangensis TaxID=3051659 RepID=A0ABT8G0T4_9MICO|nr:lytic transglycosylase domain-containing protein [Demequina sp. SYSU T00b26]MDN4472698.1 LysM peptidoglycan-binding domain-containing protein [Demequina sp. SYSU T00b26]